MIIFLAILKHLYILENDMFGMRWRSW